ncbi:hypothetical protein L2E82_31472 [Cichorium intybus]|uniref:Uncharacterized protein n=1 Tax=Cichorium intybus TaxID=13427 RepID=A0ACB9D3C6_CICIN|nr:hypothetical protein L2E82_31472 [Cichorium intybus]
MEIESLTTDDSSATMAEVLPLASVSQQPYVSELLSFTLDLIYKEPELLRVDAERIRRQMQEVAVNNYRAFISVADALVFILHEVSSIDKHLESLICSWFKLEEKMELESLTTDDSSATMAEVLPLASVSQQPYVSELLSFTLDRIHKEPELLRVDAERIRRQMQEVAVNNYRAFISAADALVSIRHEVSSIDKHLE